MTGLVFVRSGRTDLLPGGGSWSGWGSTDLVIAWTTADSPAQLAGNVVGEGGVQLVRTGGAWTIDKGYALFDSADLTRYTPGWGLGGAGALYAHELGHAVSLGHASSAEAVMYGRMSRSSTPTYQRRDLAGLAALARAGRCS